MQRLDTEYQKLSGLSERKFYSIYYSQIIPSPVLILGFNPGGDPNNWDKSVLASQTFYENNEHEYVDCDYKIAVAMRKFLINVLSLSDKEDIRNIPKTNIIFRRSISTNSLGLSKEHAILEAKPILNQILIRVAPKTIICEGIGTLEKFEKHYCENVNEFADDTKIHTPNGKNEALIYKADEGIITILSQSTKLLGIGHPSKYSYHAAWTDVCTAAKKFLKDHN